MSAATRPEPKIRRAIRFLASGRSLTCFNAPEVIHDWCVHSTVPEIEKRYGLRVDRIPTTVTGFGGVKTRCMKYRLVTEEQRDQARAILRNRK